MRKSCLACGGKLRDDQNRCALCGTASGVAPDEIELSPLLPVGGSAEGATSDVEPAGAPSAGAPSAGIPSDGTPAAGAPAASSGPFCNSCGWQNPAGARFCSRCGEKLQNLVTSEAAVALPPNPGARTTIETDSETVPETDGKVGRQVGIIVGSAVMVVLTLYMIGVVRQGGGAQAPVALGAQSGPAVPLPPGIAQQVEVLDDSVSQSEGETQVGFMRQIVELYLRAARYDFAGSSQEEVARQTLLEVDWVFAGNLYYDQMERTEPIDERTRFAKKAIAAYQEVLAMNPDNLDVRTDMAVAYLSDPDNPMSAIQETQEVLRRDSSHVQANFNRGIMLSRINRLDGAIEQFRKVQRIIGDPEDEVYKRAEEAIARLSGGVR